MPIPTGEKVAYPVGWDEGKQKVKGKQPFASIKNQKLDNMEKTLEFIYKNAQDNRLELNNLSFKAAFDKVYQLILDAGTCPDRKKPSD